MPKVSVIIPVYNVEKYLRECLDSVVNQTLSDVEIVCVNDGSTDNSLSILKEYASADNRIVVIDKENGGYASAINKGIDRANGEFIGIVESDDFCALNMYAKMYDKICDSDADFVTSDFYYIHNSERKEYRRCHYNKLLKLGRNGEFTLLSNPAVLLKPAYPWKSLYRAEFLKKNNIRMLEDGVGAYEDQPWNATVLAKAERVLYVDEPLYYYRVDATGSSTNVGTRKLISYVKRRQQTKKILIDNNCFNDDMKEYFYLSATNGCLFFLRKIAPEFKEEYYSLMREFLSESVQEGLRLKYFPFKIRRRYKKVIKYDSYRAYSLSFTQRLFEYLRGDLVCQK